jgi:prophage regulatory protein
MDRFLSEKSILGNVPWGRTTLWRKVRAGEFPPPRALSENRKGWLESEVADWINARPVADAYRALIDEPQSGGPESVEPKP